MTQWTSDQLDNLPKQRGAPVSPGRKRADMPPARRIVPIEGMRGQAEGRCVTHDRHVSAHAALVAVPRVAHRC